MRMLSSMHLLNRDVSLKFANPSSRPQPSGNLPASSFNTQRPYSTYTSPSGSVENPAQRGWGFNPAHHLKEHACEYTLGGIVTFILTVIGIGIGVGGKKCHDLHPENAVSTLYRLSGAGLVTDQKALCPHVWRDINDDVYKRNYPSYGFSKIGHIYGEMATNQSAVLGAALNQTDVSGATFNGTSWYSGGVLRASALTQEGGYKIDPSQWSLGLSQEGAAPVWNIHDDGTIKETGGFIPKRLGRIIPLDDPKRPLEPEDMALAGWTSNWADGVDGS